jgi:hypothetical protein
MKDILKKVVILDNLSSPYVHQAIIVMRDYNPKLETKAVIEAERIVNAYLDNMKLKSGQTVKKPVRHKKAVLWWVVSAVILLGAYLVFQLQ